VKGAKKLTRDSYIKETQMFQRIAGVAETPAEELGQEYDQIKGKRKGKQMKKIEIKDWQKRPQIKALVNGAFPSYRRKTIIIIPDTDVTLQQLSWDEGTRNEYRQVRTDGTALPWDNYTEGTKVEIPEGRTVLQSGTFCGKQALCYIYVNPADVQKLLPDHQA
jgi:hypothetical protein